MDLEEIRSAKSEGPVEITSLLSHVDGGLTLTVHITGTELKFGLEVRDHLLSAGPHILWPFVILSAQQAMYERQETIPDPDVLDAVEEQLQKSLMAYGVSL